MEPFVVDVTNILREKGYKKNCYALNELCQTIDLNTKNTLTKIRVFKWLGLTLLTAIPLMSTLLSILVSMKEGSQRWSADTFLYLSVALTIFTILNSIFKPSEKFQLASRLGIRIYIFKTNFLIELERMKTINEQDLLALIEAKSLAFLTYQEELVGMFMPVDLASQQGQPVSASKSVLPPKTRAAPRS